LIGIVAAWGKPQSDCTMQLHQQLGDSSSRLCVNLYNSMKNFPFCFFRLRLLISFCFSLALATTWIGPTFGQTHSNLPEKEKFHLILLVGQSNMAGRGTVTSPDQVAHPRVLMLNKDNEWVPARDPMHFDKPGIVGVGLGRTFGVQIADLDPSITVGLIPCAVGGSPIASWEPGSYYEQTKSHPYDDALRRAQASLRSGVLKAILWHQGESDSQPDLAERYEEKLHAVIARFRKDLNAPNVPFIAGQMGQFPERPWSDAKKRVDAAHRELPGKVSNTAFVHSNGLKHKGDEIHFDTESYREFGGRYVRAYQAVLQRKEKDR